MPYLLLFVFSLLHITPSLAGEAQVLAVRQMNPAMLRFFDPTPWVNTPDVPTHISLQQSYSSIFLADALPTPNRYLADMEIYTAELVVSHQLSSSFSMQLQIPAFRPVAGSMDPYLRQHHKTLGLPNGGRRFQPDNHYGYRYRGTTGGWDSQPRWEMGNIQSQWRYQWNPKDDASWRWANALAIKIPSGATSRGWSNGGTDIAFGAMVTWHNDQWATHTELWWTHPFKRQDFGSAIHDYARTSLSIDYQATFPFQAAWIAQVQGGLSPYQTGLDGLDQSPWLISAGVRLHAYNGASWALTFSENIAQQSTQDFAIGIEINMPLTLQ
ncbi:MAG: DUF3187 family protein [Mariprofundaceae bacterium]|nr:DUF3187 family protein [Mariprofundaceae bacterium]